MSTGDSTGLSTDRYSQVRTRISDAVKSSFGDAVGVDDEDTVIGKLVSIFSEVIADQNELIDYVVASFDPDNATGTALKKLVKLNGLTANEGLFSTASVSVTANSLGTTIPAGSKINDPLRPEILWSTDSEVVLAPSASAGVSVTCDVAGAIVAEAGVLSEITTPILGWSSVTNGAAATVGQNEETSTELRTRRELSSKSYGLSTFSGVWSALADLDDVDEVWVAQNLDTQPIDTNGVPYRNLWAIVDGGSDADIAEVLFKTAPIQTYGSVSEPFTFLDNSYTMYFDRPTDTAITVALTYKAISSTNPAAWPSDGDTTVKDALVAWATDNQTMGIDAIPDVISSAANVIDGYYVDVSETLLDGSNATVDAAVGERLTIASGDITITVE